MAKWRVNKERINTDIPDRQGNVVGGAVTYPTKRLIVDAKKGVNSTNYNELVYVKENIEPYKEEEREGGYVYTPKNKKVDGSPIANYIGIDMSHALEPTTQFGQNYYPTDDEFNLGLPVKGYNEPNYKIPHINYGINDFWKRSSTSIVYNKDTIGKFDTDDFVSANNRNIGNVINSNLTYGCYPLMDTTEKYSIKGETFTSSSDLFKDLMIVDLRGTYNVISFIIIEDAVYKLGSWHFHTGKDVYIGDEVTKYFPNYFLKKENNGYAVGNKDIGKTDLSVHTLYFEFENEITYYKKDESTNKYVPNPNKKTKQQLPWGSDFLKINPVILVRRLRRNEQGEVIKDEDGKLTWKLCIHAMSNTNYYLKTWKIQSSQNESVEAFFNEAILDNVKEYDDEAFDKFMNGTDTNLLIDTRFYAEEAEDGKFIKSYDVPEHELYTEDIEQEIEYRFYDKVNREEWKKTTREDISCVDGTTSGMFKGYTQQILPSTTIVKAPRCEIIDASETDEWIRGLEPENVNYSEWYTKVKEITKDSFVEAKFRVYFDDAEGRNIQLNTGSINNLSDYNKYKDGTLSRNITDYPLVNGVKPLYWYMSANKQLVDIGITLPDIYRFGDDYNLIDLYKYSGIHFYPFIKTFDPYDLSVSFMRLDGSNRERLTYTVSSADDEEHVESEGIKLDNSKYVYEGYDPSIEIVDYWVKEDKWDEENKKPIEGVTEDDK